MGTTTHAKSSVFDAKIRRLQAGGSPRCMDLFAGCGGLSLGFVSAGFRLVASIEIDPWASSSHGANFAHLSPCADSSRLHKPRDITSEEPAAIFKELGLSGSVGELVDVLVGGPPCQAFARVGRAKLRHEARRRELPDADRAFLVDGRVNLWQPYLHYVRQTKPLALLMENVPDILNHGGKNIGETVAGQLRAEGYRVRYTLLNAAWYGVPQIRERMFLIGLHESLDSDPVFPIPTHHVDLPRGYEGTRATARKILEAEMVRLDTPEMHGHRWIDDPTEESGLRATSAKEALADLPPIFAIEDCKSGRLKRGRKDPAEPCQYTSDRPTSAWSRLMREWPGYGTTGGTTGHLIRFTPRDFKFFREMHEGWEYPDVWKHVESRRRRLLNTRARRGNPLDEGSEAGMAFLRDWSLPYDPENFPNKWWKLYKEKPVRTLMAHLGKDSYSHIHFDGEQARTISIREAARLQSFPDGFVFKGTMNPAFRQIGNAVPPLLAYAIAMAMREPLGCNRLDDLRTEYLGVDASRIGTTKGKL